ncbi:MAG: carboxypeptidase regulatory-like domain-containing protein [Firmicutes bacterium]|nr:carboxypeptidase regulatory-like domain-containing protein [Bacillota bacterium]
MSRRITRLSFIALALTAGSVVAVAQSSTTGSLYGTITDAQGNPVAGATVRITSAQVTRTETTAANGTFRFGLLNPGAWRIAVTKTGMQAVNRDVTVNTNTNQQVNFRMASVSSATVEVVASQALAVDVTSTQTGMTANLSELAQLPTGRDVNSLAYFAPGVVDSGLLGGMSIAGASALENQFVVDGLASNDMREGYSGNSMATDFVEQVEVQTGGYKPEFSALGGVFNVVTKSGTNTFTGTAWFNTDLRNMQAVAKRNNFFRQAEPDTRFDYGVAVGGPILKDKLFYFVGLNNITNETPKSAQTANNNGLVNSQQKVNELQTYAKIHWYPVVDHKIDFTAKIGRVKDELPIAYPTNGTAQLGRTGKYNTDNFGLNYDWTISSGMFLSAKVGRTQYEDIVTPTNSTDPLVQDNVWFSVGPGTLPGGNPMGLPAGTRFNRGGMGRYTPLSKSTTTQYKVDFSWFLGDHNLKMGLSQMDADFTLLDGQSGPKDTPVGFTGVYPYRISIRIAPSGAFNGIDKIYYYNDAKVTGKYGAFYIQDTWELKTGLRLFYGFRFETQELRGNDGKVFLKKFDSFKDQIQPRIGFTWDMNQDGKTKVSGSYARYFEQIPMQPAMRQGGNETYVRNRYSLANTTYNPVTGAWGINAGALPSSITDFAGNFAASPLADGTKLPERRETTLGIDHTFESGWTVGVHAKHRELVHPMEDSVISDRLGNTLDAGSIIDGGGNCPGYAIIWNPGPGPVSWTANNNSMTPGAKISWSSTPFMEAFNVYQSADLTFEKKTSRWFLSGSYTWSRLYGTYEGLGQASNGQADANITSSFDYWTYVGRGVLPLDRTHVAKLFGSYSWDVMTGKLTAGFAITAQSGTPINLFDDGSTTNGHTPGYDTYNMTGDGYVTDPSAPGGKTPFYDLGGYGDAVPAHFQYGQFGRTPTNISTDLKLEYAIKLGKVNFKPSLDIFNLFNVRTASSIYQLATDQNANQDQRYGSESGWMIGRRFRFGLRIQF